ncbi:tetratricopeptide repeat protein [Pleomorphovibrio marinus]|uniref:tetratricopeptide repeat protein n=1 Tax=Pleomorphovibrio marinus TaxID=2164132 RepID=UPI000E0B97C0|nr:tetratricopeptide repeat protein [Pleomorphovibrio marinus]
MKRSQIIFLLFGVVLIVVLFSLPMVVVENNEEEGMAVEEGDLGSTFSDPQHNSSLTPEAKEAITRLKGEMEVEEDKEKFATFADSTARVFAESGKLDSAAYYYGLAADNVPNLSNLERAGNAYYEAFGFAMDEGKTSRLASKTRAYLNKVLEEDPSRLDLKTKVAMTYVSSANPMQGITMLRDILEQEPTNEEALFNMGVLSMQTGQYKRAAERFEDLVKHHPDNIQGQFYLGVSYFESNQKNKAKKHFEALRQLTEDEQILTGVENYLERL